MISRAMVAVAALGVGVVALMGDAQAQNYPPYGVQQYPPQRAPAPNMAAPDDDDDDLPPQYRAAPGSAPPPPGGYRGPYAYEPRPSAGVPGVERRDLAAPGAGDPYGGRGPTVIYGDRGAPPSDPRYAPDPRNVPDPRYGDRGPYGPPPAYRDAPPPPYGPYGAAPPPRGPYEQQGPVQIAPNQDPQDQDPRYARPPRDVT